MLKEKRQQKILEIIRQKNIAKQTEFTEILQKAGFAATQSSVSRDLDELGIVKANGFYRAPNQPNKIGLFGFYSIEPAGENLLVAKCSSGSASAVAVQIDAAKIANIVGTIAGDDTIFIAIKDSKNQKEVVREIWEIFEK